MQKNERKKYIRLIYSRTFRYLGVMLVIALLLGAMLGGGVYMMHSVCALGFVMICWGWFTYLKMTGMRFFQGRGRARVKVPYVHRRFKEKRPNRPSFRMDSMDFDDDLTADTIVSDEIFTEKQVQAAQAIARAACGLLMVALSFGIPVN